MEDKALATKFGDYRVDGSTEGEGVLSSSVDLFMFYSQTLANCAKLSTNKPFLDLVKMYQKWLDEYMQTLTAKLPKFSMPHIGTIVKIPHLKI